MKIIFLFEIRIHLFWTFVKLFEAVKSVLECLFEPLRAIPVIGPKGLFLGIGESVIVLYSFKERI